MAKYELRENQFGTSILQRYIILKPTTINKVNLDKYLTFVSI